MPWLTLAALLVLTLLVAPVAHAADAAPAAPDGWKFVTVRDETAAKSSVVRDADGTYGLAIEGNGQAISDGWWMKRLPEGAKYVSFTARYRASNIEMTPRNVVARLVWVNDEGQNLDEADYPATTAAPGAQGWRAVKSVYPVPAKARQVQMELRLQWSPQGKVEWRDAKLVGSEPPTPRKVKVASINHRPRNGKSAQENLDQFAKLIDEAGANKADIVCLPEAITLIGRGANYLGSTEPIPGPSTKFLGEHAKKNNLYVVAGLLEKDGKAAYNTAVLIGRDGQLVGKYRKVCLPRGEIDGGIAPGASYPVFDTDFGKVGMMICWDVSYPEVARELAAGGAEMIFMPIWGGNETLCRARAIENQVPLIISAYDLRSAIYDVTGEPKAVAPDTSTTIVYAEMNLAETADWKWLGKWRDRIWLEGPVRKDAKTEPVARAGDAP